MIMKMKNIIHTTSEENMRNFIITMAGSCLLFITPVLSLVLTAILFVLADTILGIYTSVKLKGWGSFTSTKLYNLSAKIFVYSGSIILAYMMDVHIFEGSISTVKFALCKSATLFCIITEVTSMNENSMKLGNRSLWVVLKELVTRISGLKKDLKKITEDNS